MPSSEALNMDIEVALSIAVSCQDHCAVSGLNHLSGMLGTLSQADGRPFLNLSCCSPQ